MSANTVTSRIVYEDGWGEIIHRPGPGVLEIRWFDSTAAMTGDAFNDWLAMFAGQVEATVSRRCFVDVLQFRMPPDRMSTGWRDEHIIPRYNHAGVERFAFLMPAGIPLIGAEPAPEGPATFPTGYFGTRQAAFDWLTAA